RGARAAGGGRRRDARPGGAQCDPRRRRDGGGARARRSHGPCGADGADRGRGLHAGGGGRDPRRARAPGYLEGGGVRLRLSRRAPKASVFGDTRLLADRVRGLAGVADARVARRLPAALKVIVREVEPVALVPAAGGLVAVDAAGRSLPFDPSRTAGGGLDLPIA